MRKLNRKGSLMIIIVIFILIFSSVAAVLELSLLQRVESKRYVQRNNGIYTADAMMDTYIYATLDVIKSPSVRFSVGPLTKPSTIDNLATSMSDTLIEPVGTGRRFKMVSIYEILGRIPLDNALLLEDIADVIKDQVKIDNSLTNTAVFQVDWENPETTDNFDGTDKFMLRPIKITFKEFYKSFSVEKVLVYHGAYLETEGELPNLTLKVNTDSAQVIVEEYNCYD